MLDGTRFCFLRQQADERRQAGRTAASPTTSRPTGDSLGAFAVGDPRRGRARRPPRGGARRLPRRSSSRRSPTGSPRPSPSGCTSGRAASGTRPASSSRTDDLRAERFRGHPARVRVPGVPRPQREGQAVRAARGPRDRPRADGELRDAPGRRGQRDLPRASRARGTSRSAGSAPTSSPTTRLVRESPWYKWRSGCGQISRSRGALRAHLSRLTALGDAPTVRITNADQAKASAALLQPSTSARAGPAGRSRRARSRRPTAPASTRRSPISSSRAMPTRATRSSRPASSSTRTSQVLRRPSGAEGLRADDLAAARPTASPTSSSKLPNVTGVSVTRVPFPKTGSVSAAYRAELDVRSAKAAG